MNDFDKYLKEKAAEEKTEIPAEVRSAIDNTLEALPVKKKERPALRVIYKSLAACACFAFIFIFLLPNVSRAYAEEAGKLPLIGRVIRVVTVRNYSYDDGKNEMNMNVPGVSADSEGAGSINTDIASLTDILLEEFYSGLDENSGKILNLDYEVLTDTEKWFTLKLTVTEVMASSYTYSKYYHIDKRTGSIIYLEDIFTSDSFGEIITKEIKRQMKEDMEDSNKIYWTDEDIFADAFAGIENNHSFYFDGEGNPVIVFDKYEVAPGYMGNPEFTIKAGLLRDIIKPEFRDIP